jgi:hypothetical protein
MPFFRLLDERCLEDLTLFAYQTRFPAGNVVDRGLVESNSSNDVRPRSAEIGSM